MKIHEYQAKEFLMRYGIATVDAVVCHTPEACLTAYQELHSQRVVIKAQVLTGGRGKAGGVKFASSQEETVEIATQMFNSTIKGFPVNKVMVARAIDIAHEYYLAIVIDRNSKAPLLMVSREGGVDIEKVAEESPEKIVKIAIDPLLGVHPFLAKKGARHLFDKKEEIDKVADIIKKLYRIMVKSDATMVEINPLVKTTTGELVALDSKILFDNNALYRQPTLAPLRELSEEEVVEEEAKSKGFSFIKLDGNIGCIVNGAGLAMSTMDTIKLYGGEPANFLDIGGSSNPEKVKEAVKLLMRDPNIEVILVNIFGGITRGDDVANGLLTAFKEVGCDFPVVIRLTGTNEKEGREILKESPFHIEESMGAAVQKAISLI